MPARCEKLEANLKSCTCTYTGCPRHGNCCACLRYHLEARELPGCVFPVEVEKAFDRSFDRFIKTYR